MTDRKMIIVALIAVCIVLGAVVIIWKGGDGESDAAKSDSAPVFDSNVYRKEGTPPAEEILAALRSDNQDSIWSVHILLKRIVSEEKLNWPSGLRKEEVYGNRGLTPLYAL